MAQELLNFFRIPLAPVLAQLALNNLALYLKDLKSLVLVISALKLELIFRIKP